MTAAISPESRQHRARLAQKTRKLGPDSAETLDARRDYAAARLEDHVRQTVASAPPLTDEQRSRIAALLQVGGAA